MPDIPANKKIQPWRAHWPPTNPVDSRFMAGLKKGDLLTVDGGGINTGTFGYNDKVASDAAPKDKKGEK